MRRITVGKLVTTPSGTRVKIMQEIYSPYEGYIYEGDDGNYYDPADLVNVPKTAATQGEKE